MYPWFRKSYWLGIALLSFICFLVSSGYFYTFTLQSDVEILQFEKEGASCYRMTDVSGSKANSWPKTEMEFLGLDSRTPLDIDNARTSTVLW